MKNRKRLLILAAIFVLYILSAGPVVGTLSRTAGSEANHIIAPVVVIFYAPLEFVANRVPPFKKAMQWYARLFNQSENDEDESGG